MKIKLLQAYRKELRKCNYYVAHKLLRLLINKNISLDLSDESFEVEKICEKIGLNINYSYNGNTAYVYLNKEIKKVI